MANRMCVALCAGVVWLMAALVSAQPLTGAAGAASDESLGSRLMEGLPVGPSLPAGDESLGRRDAATVQDGAAAPGLADDEGEDIGGASGPLPLMRAQYGMRTAEALLMTSREVDRTGRVQDEVVSELDALIAELSKQCRSCASCQGSCDKPGAARRSPKAGTAAKIKPGHGTTPARDSNDRLDRARAEPVDAADVQTLLKNVWGHLPERVREQMLQSYSDGFLPQYELEIEKYYRGLAEEGAGGGD